MHVLYVNCGVYFALIKITYFTYLHADTYTYTSEKRCHIISRFLHTVDAFSCQVTSPDLDQMFSSLDAEAKELDRIQMNVTAGSRLLQEKEDKLRQLEEALFQDQVRSILFHSFT